jgi:PAS domain S-box-containing protein
MPPDSETELRSIFDQAPVGLAQCRPGGEITLRNSALEQMFGLNSHPGRALHFGDLVPAEDRNNAERLLRELFAGKRNSFKFETKSSAPGGSRTFKETAIRWTAWRPSSRSASSSYALLFAQEIREPELAPPAEQQEELQAEQQEKQQQEKHPDPADEIHSSDAIDSDDSEGRLRHAQRLESVGRLAGGIAHDFNNLLTGVLLYCDLLAASLDSGHRARKYVEEIRHAGLHATDLVRQLLAVSRPADSSPRLLCLNDIVEGMRNLLLRLIGENIRLAFHLDPSLGLVHMDHTQGQQILLNLVLNARDAMPAGGEIRIETRNCRVQVLPEAASRATASALPCVLFTVADQGHGMDAATRTRMFEPFFTTKSSSQGTGLGLATVKDIVTRNGGLIHVESVPRRGTCVSVLLPLAPAPTAPSDSQKDSQNTDFQKKDSQKRDSQKEDSLNIASSQPERKNETLIPIIREE